MNEHTAQDELERKLLAWSRKKRNRVTLEYFFGMRDSVENNKPAKVCETCQKCGGNGFTEDEKMNVLSCEQCKGTGKKPADECPTCKGIGETKSFGCEPKPCGACMGTGKK